jgi:hypothetical protein
MKKLAVLMLAAATAIPAFADPPTPAPATGGDPNEIICRTMTVIGSRLGRTRQCATRAEWTRLQSAERESTRNALRQGTQPTCMSAPERATVNGRYNALGGSCQN